MSLKGQHLKLFTAIYFFLVCLLELSSATEVTVSTYMVDKSLKFDVNLPVLVCHAKYLGYNEVRWYKDGKLLKKGSAEPSDHVFSVSLLLDERHPLSPYHNPLKLQGYYWCETDFVVPSETFKYLFRIPSEIVDTFVGRMLATEDSLGDYKVTSFEAKNRDLTLEEKIALKKAVYENDMQEDLFGFLPYPNTFVTDIQVKEKGLEIQFYLYARQKYLGRRPFDIELAKDRDQLFYVLEYLRNETDTDSHMYEKILDWVALKGIRLRDISINSTIGCYEKKSTVPADPPILVTWPGARIDEIVIPLEGCSSKNGLAVTRMCTGSFDMGARWGSPSGKCDKPATGLTKKLKEVYDDFGNDLKPTYIQNLLKLLEEPSQITVPDMHIIAKILKALSDVQELTNEEIDGVFSVIDILPQSNRSELMAAKSTVRLTGRILRVINNIIELAAQKKKDILISKRHLLVDTKATNVANNSDLILGVAVKLPSKAKDLQEGSIDFLTTNTKLPLHNSLAFFLLPPDLVLEREEILNFPCHVNMVFFKDWQLFPNPKDKLIKRNYKVLQTPVMAASLSGGPAWDLKNPVQIFFKNTIHREIEDPVCVHYEPRLDDGVGGWSTEGCEFGGLKDGFYKCQCHHLSIFAVILSERPDLKHKYNMSKAAYVGCGAAVIALAFTVLLYLLSKHWRSTVDHHILFSLALSFLMCVILIFLCDQYYKEKWSCIVLALSLHYFIFSVLGWLLVIAVIYQLRFAKKTDVSEIPYLMLKAAFCVWGAALIIVLLIAFTKDFPTHQTCLRSIADVSSVSVIPIAVIMLITLCVNVCAAYAVTCRFRKDFLIDDSSFSEPAIKFRVSFSIYVCFVATWLFGFFALHEKYEPLKILFSICIALTAYYVALFFVFHEISLWSLCRCNKKEPEATPAVKYEAKSYDSTEK